MNTNGPRLRKPLRLWPGVAGAVLLVIVGYVVPIVVPAYAGLAMISGAARSFSFCGGCSSVVRAGT